MIQVNRLLGRMFPIMALSGLLLAGWGLIITPDDARGARGSIGSSHALIASFSDNAPVSFAPISDLP